MADLKSLLALQMGGSCNLLGELSGSMTEAEWRSRPHPRANRLGFVVWHGARSIDWTLAAVSGESELAEREGWLDLEPDGAWWGAGTPAAIADKLPELVSRERLAAYLVELQRLSQAWLLAATEADLERPIDLRRRFAARPEYVQPPVWDEISDLDGRPAWELLARPAISHIRVHYGEARAGLEQVRGA